MFHERKCSKFLSIQKGKAVNAEFCFERRSNGFKESTWLDVSWRGLRPLLFVFSFMIADRTTADEKPYSDFLGSLHPDQFVSMDSGQDLDAYRAELCAILGGKKHSESFSPDSNAQKLAKRSRIQFDCFDKEAIFATNVIAAGDWYEEWDSMVAESHIAGKLPRLFLLIENSDDIASARAFYTFWRGEYFPGRIGFIDARSRHR